MEPKILNKSGTIKYIYHLSDIHIRINQRHKEYLHVFKNLYEYLKKDVKPNSIIVITGDILHSKTELSPECIALTSSFFKELSSIAPLIIIPGNHDCNLMNKQRLDALTPIVNDINSYDNLFYLKETGLYSYGDTMFVFTSVFDEEFISIDDFDKSKKNIYLYHGAVHKAETDVGARMNREELTIEKFAGYDYVLLGDIHKFQYLNKEKTIAYAGSLIQQNHGELLSGHGLIKWELGVGSKHIPIKNDYGYCTVRINDGMEEETVLPKYPRIKFIVTNTSGAKKDELIEQLKSQYKVQEYFCSVEDVVEEKQHKSVEEYLAKSPLKEDILKLHQELEKKLVKKETYEKGRVEFDVLSFSNMLSYGEDNVIDFTKFQRHKIIGIMAPNHYGKSAIIDILLYVLFGKFSRGSPKDILNKMKDDFKCSLCFSCSDKRFMIERSGSKKSSQVKFYEVLDDEYVDLNGVDKNETDSKICSYVGTYENYVNTYFSLQNNGNNFSDMKPLERKNYLYEILSLNLYEELFLIAKEEHKSLLKSLQNEQELLFKYDLKQFKQRQVEYCRQYHLLEKEYSKFKQRKYPYYYDVNVLNKEIKELNDIMAEKDKQIDELEKTFEGSTDILKKEEYSSMLKSSKKELNSVDKQLTEIEIVHIDDSVREKAKHNITIGKKPTHDKTKLLQVMEKYNVPAQTESQYDYKRRKYKIKNNFEVVKTEFYDLLEYNEKCYCCCNNKRIIGKSSESIRYAEYAKKERGQIDGNLQAIKHLVSKIYNNYTEEIVMILNEIDEYEQSVKDYAECKEALILVQQNQEAISKSTELKERKRELLEIILLCETELEKISVCEKGDETIVAKDIQRLKEEKVIAENNVEEKRKLLVLAEEQAVERDKYAKHLIEKERLNRLSQKIRETTKKVAEIKAQIDKVNELERMNEIYKAYLKMTHANGLPSVVLEKYLPQIEMKVNNILSGMTTFTIKFNKLELQIVSNREYNLRLASGFEKFISNLAIRMALAELSDIVKPNLMVIDEGWSCLDNNNLNNVSSVLNYLRKEFDHVIIISHLDQLKGEVDDVITINRKNNFSFL